MALTPLNIVGVFDTSTNKLAGFSTPDGTGYTAVGQVGNQTSVTYDSTNTITNPAARAAVAEAASYEVNVKTHFGASGLGVTDDSAAFLAALTYCETYGLPLTVPSGTYLLSTWKTRNSTFVMLRGAGIRATTIRGPKTIGEHFVKMTGGVFDTEGISFEKFDNVAYSEAAVDIVRIAKCKAKWCRSYFYRQADVTDYPSSSTGMVILEDNEVENSGGFMMHGALTQGGIARGNIMKNVKRDTAIWPADTPLYQTFGISFGDTDNNKASVAQELTQNVVVECNVINGMYNATPAGTFNTTNAIQVSAINATIVGNTVSGMDAADRGNNDAIYCKAQNYVIEGNAINGSKTTSACIAIKGTLTDAGPMQRNSVVANNPIRSVDGLCDSGIVLFAGGYCDIVGNPITGMAVDSIKVLGDPVRVRVLNNPINDNAGAEAVTFRCGSITACEVDGNTLYGAHATTGNLRPFRFTAVATQLSTITVTGGGSGYTSAPTVTITGGGGVATAQATILGGVVIGIHVNSSDAGFTSTPTVSITGGGGSGATATAVLSTGAINDLNVSRNRVRWSPRSTLTTACGIYMQAGSAAASSSGGIVEKDNEFIADSFASMNPIQGVNFYSATAGWLRDAIISGLHMTVPDVTKVRPVNFNSSVNLYTQDAHYENLSVNRVSVNGRPQRILSKAQIDDTRATFVINCNGKDIGSNLIGYIPNSVMAIRGILFNTTAPTSSTNVATIAFSLGSAGTKNLLGDTVVSAFSANSFKDIIPTGTAANAKRAFVSSGLVPVYMDVGGQALTGGVLTLVLDTEAVV